MNRPLASSMLRLLASQYHRWLKPQRQRRKTIRQVSSSLLCSLLRRCGSKTALSRRLTRPHPNRFRPPARARARSIPIPPLPNQLRPPPQSRAAMAGEAMPACLTRPKAAAAAGAAGTDGKRSSASGPEDPDPKRTRVYMPVVATAVKSGQPLPLFPPAAALASAPVAPPKRRRVGQMPAGSSALTQFGVVVAPGPAVPPPLPLAGVSPAAGRGRGRGRGGGPGLVCTLSNTLNASEGAT